MLLAVDIGNTDIVFGIYDETWLYQWRHPSSEFVTADRTLISKAAETNLDLTKIDRVVLSSVVPNATEKVKELLTDKLGKEPFTLGPDLFSRISMGIKNPAEIGSDLVANAFAAYQKFQQACVVVDFGTALTFTTISQDGEILGVAIAPGLKTAMNALFSNTAQLAMVPLEIPKSALGKDTPHALQAGILLGYVGLVKELLDRISDELKMPIKVAATGGLSSVLTPLHDRFDIIDKMLTLDGLRLLEEKFREK